MQERDEEMPRLSVSAQHYIFMIDALIDMMNEELGVQRNYELRVRKCRTMEVIDDIVTRRSQLGVLYLSNMTERFMRELLDKNGIEFTPLAEFGAHVYLRRSHPLARIEPSEGVLYSPADGEISNLFDTGHAIGVMTDEECDILLHIGIDTVKLEGKYFEPLVKEGDKVKKGDPLIKFDIDAIKEAGYKVTTPMIVCNTDDYSLIRPLKSGTVKVGDDFMEVLG